MLTGLLLTFFVTALTGCLTNERVVTSFITPTVSKSIRTCADAPNKPGGVYTQKEVARFVTELSYAHGNCKANLAAVDRSLTQFENEVSPGE